MGKRKRQTTADHPNPLPDGAFVRHLKSGATGRVINGRRNLYYNYAEYQIKLTTSDGKYKKTLWSMWNVEQIAEPEAKSQEPEKTEPEPVKKSFRDIDPLINPFRSGLFFSEKFWLTPEPKKNIDI